MISHLLFFALKNILVLLAKPDSGKLRCPVTAFITKFSTPVLLHFDTHLIQFSTFSLWFISILGQPLATAITTCHTNAHNYSTIDGSSCTVYEGVTSSAPRFPTVVPQKCLSDARTFPLKVFSVACAWPNIFIFSFFVYIVEFFQQLGHSNIIFYHFYLLFYHSLKKM